MSAATKLAHYPAAYTRILLSLPADGSPLEFDLSSHEAAKQERLRFYNFLKFLSRNPDCSAPFGTRHEEVRISVKDKTMRFQLRTAHKNCELNDALEHALGGLTAPALNKAVTELPFATAATATAPIIPDTDPTDRPNVLDTFLTSIGAK